MMLIVGYDDTTGEFIVNDPGDTKAGKFHRYEYKLFMNTLHDFDFTTHQANGPAKVIFTYPRLARDYSDGRIYFLDIDKKIKQHVVSLAVFKEKNWSWDMVVDVWDEWLDEFSAGKDLDSSASAGPSAPISVQPAVNRYTFTRDLSLGSSGEEVKQLQIRLKELKYYTYPQITGYFGPVTQTAVVALQKAKGLAPYPGTVGPLTRKVLNSY
ncbi:MAG: hypothetical protein COU31_01000 [Candidatus Magasanikbacteria bacterium CG10_big_fil_rev_8_21_14_0_10_40_10]|uniref:Peptidoglycan binding-like domain-containing protein n=1 Tax=Candidatus Magasanikbacteria bacterium CG10_big_fil_rev_8_21_14_0_10_40_10 TaxID=1974648 RepID=A0A2M6W4U3_9BACT|nr:MAG: hypothetical protein COU31_01000 [Candidatus Magasanikbacteria bacterium CG10_big_fil_rev_8_21_14_0_10_40_10]